MNVISRFASQVLGPIERFFFDRERPTSAFVLAALLCVTGGATAGGPADQAATQASTVDEGNDRFIVKLRDPAAELRDRLPAIAGRAGAGFTFVRSMSGGAAVVRMTRLPQTSLTVGQTTAERNRLVALQLTQDPEVQYAEPDRRMVPLITPNDPQYPQQWNYFEAAGGVNLPAAWNTTTGSSSIVIALIDTGIRPHVDLAGRTVPGYDFVSDATTANDGDGRDADPSDPGDYGCNGSTSSWHGTHVAGTLGAASNNGIGVAGVNWVSKILVARSLGRCGGYTSDIVDAMRWSAGIAVAGVPANANPARVENMSLGGAGNCSNSFQSAINDVVARGTVVVVAAGNSGADVATSSPANCVGVIAVAATTRAGGLASFSNFGSKVTISAPGVGILSTLNAGTTTPGADSYASYSGTSMATPHVAGIVSLMLSQNPALTPAQVTARLQQTARTFPTGTGRDCTTALCGAGIVDAAAALAPIAPPARVNLAAQANGGVASASSTYSGGYPPSGANDGDRRGLNWEAGGGWNDATLNSYPDWIRIDFPTAQPLTEIDVYTVQDNYKNPVEPTDAMTFALYGITAFDVQYWSGSAWVTVPNGSVSGNNKVINRFTFAPITTTSIRVQVNAALAGYSRVIEIEAYKDPTPINVARPGNGGTASASSTISAGYPPSGANDGDRRGLYWESGGGWNDATLNSFPDQLQVNFNGTKAIGEIDVFTVQDDYKNPIEPTQTMTFSLYGITDFDVQYWDGGNWVTIPNGSVSGNNLVWRKFTFPPIATTAVRVNVRNALNGYSRIIELEAYVLP